MTSDDNYNGSMEDVVEDIMDSELRQLISQAELFELGSQLSDPEARQHLSPEQLQLLVDKKDEALVLAAKLGHNLLSKLAKLSTENKRLEQQIDQSADQISQLEFDKSQLNSQLKLAASFCDDTDDDHDSLDGTTSYSNRWRHSSGSCSCSVAAAAASDETDALRSRLKQMEAERDGLQGRVEELERVLEAERQVDRQRQADRHRDQNELRVMRDKMAAKRRVVERTEEQLNRAKLEIVYLAGQLVQMEADMEKLQSRLEETLRQNSTLEMKYDEMLAERNDYESVCNALRESSRGRHRLRRMTICGASSIAQELSNCSTPTTPTLASNITFTPQHAQGVQQRLFETMRYLNMTVACPRQCPVSTSVQCRVVSHCQCTHNTQHNADNSLQMHWIQQSVGGRRVLGQPGRPGSTDLNHSLLRLQWLADKQCRRLGLPPPTQDPAADLLSPDSAECSQCDCTQTFENVALPPHSKLQLVKVLEGSWMLYTWQRLSSCDLGTLFDERRGVLTRCSSHVLGHAPRAQSCCTVNSLASTPQLSPDIAGPHSGHHCGPHSSPHSGPHSGPDRVGLNSAARVSPASNLHSFNNFGPNSGSHSSTNAGLNFIGNFSNLRPNSAAKDGPMPNQNSAQTSFKVDLFSSVVPSTTKNIIHKVSPQGPVARRHCSLAAPSLASCVEEELEQDLDSSYSSTDCDDDYDDY